MHNTIHTSFFPFYPLSSPLCTSTQRIIHILLILTVSLAEHPSSIYRTRKNCYDERKLQDHRCIESFNVILSFSSLLFGCLDKQRIHLPKKTCLDWRLGMAFCNVGCVQMMLGMKVRFNWFLQSDFHLPKIYNGDYSFLL